jgi:cytochrome c oxidase subunit 2
VAVIGVVGLRIIYIIINLFINSSVLESQILECVWTIIPALILVEIAVPSLMLLYVIDEVRDRLITLKITGYQ